MNEEEKKAVKYFYNLRATIDESNMLFDEEINVKHGKEKIKQITIILNLIEKLQKENEDLKAKLEYKEYGDLDNTEFEKYINEIVETRTKELREQLEEEQELNKIIKETRINKVLENNIEVKKLREENEELKADNYELNNRINDLLENIPIQKIKDIIDRIDYDIEKTKEIISKNTNINASYRKNDYQIVRLRAMNTKSLDIKKRLQELLESEE